MLRRRRDAAAAIAFAATPMSAVRRASWRQLRHATHDAMPCRRFRLSLPAMPPCPGDVIINILLPATIAAASGMFDIRYFSTPAAELCR